MRKTIGIRLSGLFAMFSLSLCQAGAITVPPSADSQGGTANWGFGAFSSEQVTQNLLPVAELAGLDVGDRITGLRLRADHTPFPASDYSWGRFDITLGRGLGSLTGNFAANFDSGVVQVRSGGLTVGAGFFPGGGSGGLNPFGGSIVFDTPYVYSGGALLIEIRHQSDPSGFSFGADVMESHQTSGEMAAAFGDADAANANLIQSNNFAMQLDIAEVSAPTPTWLMLLGFSLFTGFGRRLFSEAHG